MSNQKSPLKFYSARKSSYFLLMAFLLCDSGLALSLSFFAYFLSETIFGGASPDLFLYCLLGSLVATALTIVASLWMKKRMPLDWCMRGFGSFQVLWSFVCLFHSLFLLYLYIRLNPPFNPVLSSGKYGYYCLFETLASGFAFLVPFLILIPTKKERQAHDQAI